MKVTVLLSDMKERNRQSISRQISFTDHGSIYWAYEANRLIFVLDAVCLWYVGFHTFGMPHSHHHGGDALDMYITYVAHGGISLESLQHRYLSLFWCEQTGNNAGVKSYETNLCTLNIHLKEFLIIWKIPLKDFILTNHSSPEISLEYAF